MPYRLGHYWVGLVLIVIVAGFWASYFRLVGEVPLAFHIHAFTAMCWLLLLIVQSVSIHRRLNGFHKLVGQASFALFPLLIGGLVMIINRSAERFAAQENAFITMLAPSFGIGMLVAILAYLTLFYLALRHRHDLKLHAGYMLATPMILFESPFSRLMEQVAPWMNVIGSEGPRAVLDTIAISDGIVATFALLLYLRDRKHGAPWLVAMGFVLTQAVLMWFGPDIPGFTRMFAAYALLPGGLTVTLGLLAGALAAWAGWTRGARPRRRMAARPA